MNSKRNKLVGTVIMFAGILFVAKLSSAQHIRGNGNIQTQSREVGAFDKINSSGPFDISLTWGNASPVTISGDENILPYIITDVKGNTLVLKTKRGVNIQPGHKITVAVTVNNLEEVKMSGAGALKSTNTLHPDHLLIQVSGTGNIDLDFKSNSFRTDISGTTKADFKGSSTKVEYRISGTANINAEDMVSDNTEVVISGVGKVHVNAQKNLEVAISGVGKIWYKGTPAISQSVSGMGSIKKE